MRLYNICASHNIPPPIIIPLALGVLAPSLLGTSAWLFNGELAPTALPPCWLWLWLPFGLDLKNSGLDVGGA